MTTAATNPTARPKVHSHPETILGTCQAIGDDLGISPNWLRALFGIALVWNIAIAISAYLALSAAVALLRWILPDERATVDQAVAGNDPAPVETRAAA